MNTEHAGAIKGLSIANLVLSIVTLLGVLTGLITFGVFGSTVADMNVDTIDYYGPALANSLAELYDETGIYLSPSDLMHFIVGAMAIGGFILVVALIMNALALIASIIGIRFYNQKEKLGLIMSWSIAGAIVSFLGGDIVTLVMFIIVAVFAYKDKHATPIYQQPSYAQTYSAFSGVPSQQYPYSAPSSAPSSQYQGYQPSVYAFPAQEGSAPQGSMPQGSTSRESTPEKSAPVPQENTPEKSAPIPAPNENVPESTPYESAPAEPASPISDAGQQER